jgi:alpha-1,2-glucosyltransferase
MFSEMSDFGCSLRALRALNLIGVAVVLPLVVSRLLNHHSVPSIGQLPLIFFFSFLFYTDVWSTIFVLLSFTTPNPVLAAVWGAVSVTFRQTNIVWVAFIAAYKISEQSDGLQDFIVKAIHSFNITLPFGAVGVGFIAFLTINGGITMGDKSNHEMRVNIPQLLYFSLFLLFFSWPLWMSPRMVSRYLRWNFGSPHRAVLYFCSLALIASIVQEFTVVHPFILADNRHYTFYLWRRLIMPTGHPLAKFLLVPIYHLGLWILVTSIGLTNSLPVFLAYFATLALTLVPSPLLEPRYYILPYIVWRIIVPHYPQNRTVLEWLWYLAINSITIRVFLKRPFEWPGETQLQRFMW